MPLPKDDLFNSTVRTWIKNNPNLRQMSIEKIKHSVLVVTMSVVEAQNSIGPKSQRIKVPDMLTAGQIAMLIPSYKDVALISCDKNGGSNFMLLGMYMESGPNAGIYDTSEDALDRLINLFNYEADDRFVNKVKGMLRRSLEKKERCTDPDLIPVNNGIYNYKTKQLLPFTPDKIFLSKSHVDFNPNAQNVTIHNPTDGTDWNVEDWMKSLSDDPEVVNLLWRVVGAVIRPHVRWGKCVYLYSRSGNSGKGTLCELMRNICGLESCCSISLTQFDKDFYLEDLITSNAIICDENEVGAYLETAANFKAIITCDTVLINRKYKSLVNFQPFCVVIQCLNEYPNYRDKTPSLRRRQLFIPFDKNFEGVDRKYIKYDYLSRPDVLEYVLYRVLTMPDYYELGEPAACRQVLDDVTVNNDPVKEYLDEMLPQFKWRLVPDPFLYDLFTEWFHRAHPAGKVTGRNTFLRQVEEYIKSNSDWEYRRNPVTNAKLSVRSKNYMGSRTDNAGRLIADYEPLVNIYKLEHWGYVPMSGGCRCDFLPADSYKGIVRKTPVNPGPGAPAQANPYAADPFATQDNRVDDIASNNSSNQLEKNTSG